MMHKLKSVDNIFSINLAVKRNDKVLVFTDAYKRNIKKIAGTVAKAGEQFTDHIQYIEYSPTGCHGTEPPEELWIEAFGLNAVTELRSKNLLKLLLEKKISESRIRLAEQIIRKNKKDSVNAVIALSYFSTSHTRFRDILNRICRARYASMPLFDEQMLEGAMTVNWNAMQKRTESIAGIVNKYQDIEIETPNGTFISFSKKGRNAKADTGIIKKPGSFSNLPAGEVYLAPLEGTANGKLVLDWAPTRKLRHPVILHVKNGMVHNIEGQEKFADYLKGILAGKKQNRNIAELGIGTNDKDARPDNILESEKIFGTIHIALGDNSTFGGKVSASFHQDFVFFKPTVILISKGGRRRVLLNKGKLMRNNY